MCDVKREMRERVRLARGLANALGYDIEYVFTDIENFDFICLDESIREAKDTIKNLVANIAEIEYLVDLAKKEISRK